MISGLLTLQMMTINGKLYQAPSAKQLFLGKAAYNRYGETLEFTNFMGGPMPTWEALSALQQIGWAAAACPSYRPKHTGPQAPLSFIERIDESRVKLKGKRTVSEWVLKRVSAGGHIKICEITGKRLVSGDMAYKPTSQAYIASRRISEEGMRKLEQPPV